MVANNQLEELSMSHERALTFEEIIKARSEKEVITPRIRQPFIRGTI